MNRKTFVVRPSSLDTPPEPTLTAHQQAAYDEVYARLMDGERFTSLQGYAGTGKTYLIGRLVDQLTSERHRVNVCAPTHKAAQVLREKIEDAWISTQTIHSFLGLRLVPDKKGGYKLEPERHRELPKDGIVIVDEASMIGADEWAHIMEAPGLRWLFVGDPAQLPPVNEGASEALSVPGSQLEEVVRQARENPILTLATRLRNHERIRWKGEIRAGDGIGVTDNREAFLASALRAFRAPAFKRNATHARVLAYRNKTVEFYNRAIRNALFDTAVERFAKGEWLVARDTWYHEDIPYLINSEEVRVKRASVDEVLELSTGLWKTWNLEVRSAGGLRSRYLSVLHEDEHKRYKAALARLRKEAVDNEKKWPNFYALKERFAQVDYAYASTIHKAQGSTFHTAFVDRRDAVRCRGPERHALLYVAVTRPARRLALLV